VVGLVELVDEVLLVESEDGEVELVELEDDVPLVETDEKKDALGTVLLSLVMTIASILVPSSLCLMVRVCLPVARL
jgi:hypothetical protein